MYRQACKTDLVWRRNFKFSKFAPGKSQNLPPAIFSMLRFDGFAVLNFTPEFLQTAPPSWILPPNFYRRLRRLEFCPRVLLDGSAVLNFAPELLQTASPSEFCLRQVRYLAPPAPKSFNFTFSSLRLENLPPAWKFAPGEVLSISPQFYTPDRHSVYVWP